jgi:ATP-binding cassette subfamily C protein LapB
LLAIARLMLRDPALVFLDEPTSMMDQTTEAKVIQVLGTWLEGRTMVLSTHRLQLLTWVERVALIDQGQLLLDGPREAVLEKLSTGVRMKPAAGKTSRATAQTDFEAATPTSPVAPAAV